MEASSFEFSGFWHMDPDHNILFSIPESTCEIGIDLMGAEPCLGLTSGAPASTSGYGVGYSTLPFDLSTDASSAGRNLGDDSSSLLTTEDAETIPYAVVGTSIIAAVAAIVDKISPNVFRIITLKNDRANSYVEKNAAAVYDSLHGEPNKTYTFPAVIIDSPGGYDVAAKIFDKGSLEKTIDTLEIWESILEEHV